MKSYATKSPLLSDNDYIHGLKNLDNRVTHQFFYKECYFLLNEIKYSLYNGKVGYDELVNEHIWNSMLETGKDWILF